MDEDLEEMRALRAARWEQQKKATAGKKSAEKLSSSHMQTSRQNASSSSEGSQDQEPDMAKLMGFSGFGKKARTFDLDKMFEQTRRTAQEISKSKSKADSGDDDDSDAEGDDPRKRFVQKTANKSKQADSDDDDDDMIGPPLPPGFSRPSTSNKAATESDDDDDEDYEDDDEDNLPPEKKIPATHEIVLNHGNKSVSAVALDPSGSRLVTGGYDFDVRFWDFAAMDPSLNSFRSFQPFECHQIRTLQYSITGDRILMVAAKPQAKVVDRDGFEVMECVKGDQYIVDMAKTKGHTAMLNGGCWNPKVKEEFITCANDGTVRLWDVNQAWKQQQVIKFRGQGGQKTNPTCCVYSRDAKLIGAGCQDGSIQLWDMKRPLVRPTYQQKNAHGKGTDTSCITFSYDNLIFVTRGGDDTMKSWDLRNFKRPVNVVTGLESFYPVAECCFSPDDKMILAGQSVRREQEGKLMFYDRTTFKKITELECGQGSVVRCMWHPKLNQIIIGSGSGLAKVFYDPNRSHRGAKLCMVKKRRKRVEPDIVKSEHIVAPVMSRRGRHRNREEPQEIMAYKKQMKDRQDPVKSRKPDLPIKQGQGGRIAAGGSTLSRYVAINIALTKKVDPNISARDAILRHAKDAEENPLWIAPAYKHTQPNPIFHESDEEEEEEEGGPSWSKKAKLDSDSKK
nr:WD repeat-containing protein 70-like [Lytechinus pictus]